MKSRTFLLTAAAALLAGSFASGIALASSQKLHGSFGGVGEFACLSSPSGFNPDFTPVDSSTASTSSGNVSATFTFKQNGTGTLNTANVTISGAGGSSSEALNVPFQYTVDKKGLITITAPSSTFTGSITSGPRSGQTFTIDTWTVDAHQAQGDKGIAVATAAPFVETISFSDGSSVQRICHRESSLLPINPSSLNGD